MKINIKNDTMYVSGVKELTAQTSDNMRSRVRKEFVSGLSAIELQFDGAGFVDSSGLGVLLSMQKLTRERNGSFQIVNPPMSVMQVLELTQLHRLFTIVAKEDNLSCQ